MKTQNRKVTGDQLGRPSPRKSHHMDNDVHELSFSGNDMNVPIEAVRSVAKDYRINPDIFYDWLERKGYCIQDEVL